MRMQRLFVVAMLVGVLGSTAVPKAHAMDPYAQDLLSNMLYGLVLGTPYGPSGNLPSGTYRTSPYDPYGNSSYGPYGNPPYDDPYGRLDNCRCDRPAGGYYGPSPYDYYQGSDNRYRDQERLGRLNRKYEKAMNRLERQEAEARAKAYRKSKGDPVRYREKLAKIDRKYEHKRNKVERNTAQAYRKLSDRY